MENSFFQKTWRGKEIKTSDEDKNLPLGQYDLIRVENKFIDESSLKRLLGKNRELFSQSKLFISRSYNMLNNNMLKIYQHYC
ncbi:MAG: hypothetical protein K0B08_10240, partial [Bacteroidales bacterium]|nr:hypothetical protein [Bacteroidales bacterium]